MAEELSPTAKRLKEQHEKRSFNREKAESKTALSTIAHEVHVTARFVTNLTNVLVWIWVHFLAPFAWVFSWPIIKWFAGKYIALWNHVTRYTDKYGNDKFSRKKGVGMVLATAMVAFLSFNAIQIGVDWGIYSVSHEKRTVWLSLPQEIYPGANVFSVQGCAVALGEENASVIHCDDENSLYFRVRPTMFNEFWSILHGKGIFFPELIVSPIGASWSKCVVDTYNFRIKILMGFGDWYPDLISAKCERSSAS